MECCTYNIAVIHLMRDASACIKVQMLEPIVKILFNSGCGGERNRNVGWVGRERGVSQVEDGWHLSIQWHSVASLSS